MAWLTRPSGKRYLYISYWSSDQKKCFTRYIPLDQAAAVAQSAEQKAQRKTLAREAKAAYRAVLAKQRRQKPE